MLLLYYPINDKTNSCTSSNFIVPVSLTIVMFFTNFIISSFYEKSVKPKNMFHTNLYLHYFMYRLNSYTFYAILLQLIFINIYLFYYYFIHRNTCFRRFYFCLCYFIQYVITRNHLTKNGMFVMKIWGAAKLVKIYCCFF